MAVDSGDRLTEWNGTWALAVAFGAVSVPWTYSFVAILGLPLWPSFLASAAYFAADEDGIHGAITTIASLVSGSGYAALTLVVVSGLGGHPVALAVVVGVAMTVASLHGVVDLLSFTPGAFVGYATLFGVHAAEASMLWPGVAGETVAATLAMAIGCTLGLTADRLGQAIIA